jgi:hypothetical protein
MDIFPHVYVTFFLHRLSGHFDRGAARVQLGDAVGALPELARDAHARVAQLDLVPVRAHALDRGEAEGSALRNGQKWTGPCHA